MINKKSYNKQRKDFDREGGGECKKTQTLLVNEHGVQKNKNKI